MEFEKTLSDLKDAARIEDWDSVDLSIPVIARDPRFYEWAFKEGMEEINVDVRDLAASIIEKSDIEAREFSRMRDALFVHMTSDENKYVRFRLAFALAKHGSGEYKRQVVDVLKEASTDKDVKEIANRYLHRIVHQKVTR